MAIRYAELLTSGFDVIEITGPLIEKLGHMISKQYVADGFKLNWRKVQYFTNLAQLVENYKT